MNKKFNPKKTVIQASVDKFLDAQQLELGHMNILSILQLGSQTLLKEAINQEITQYLGRDFYKHLTPGQKDKGQRNGYRKTVHK